MRWLLGKRPQKPAGWDTRVRAAKKRAERWANGTLKLKKGETFEFEDLWSAHKVAFALAIHGKCAYCELPIDDDDAGGDLDHYRPKKEITELSDDPTTWGEEREGHNSRDPKSPRKMPRVARGYFWLAYEWDNYIFSCGTCNSKWKDNLFPIVGGHHGDPTPASCAQEKPLLLDPYGSVNPANHLEFDKSGLVTERNDSEFGIETIRVCSLMRYTLLAARRRVAREAWGYIKNLNNELKTMPHHDEPRLRRALKNVLHYGHSKEPHAGMVRILWKQADEVGFSWKQLRALQKALSP